MDGEPGVERRLAAILAADVVGYSRLMEADEAGTHARLKAVRRELIEPRIAERRGRIVKLTGDGALVEFPSVVEAVLCAVDVQRTVAERNAEVSQDQRIEFRIGVNLGDVIIEDDDIYGDGVNVAARLQTLAEPGGICVARTVYNHVKNKVGLAFEPMGEHKVKNITEPITVYRVLPGWGGAAKTGPLGLASALRARRPAAAAAAVAVFLLAGAAGAWYAFWWPGSEPPPTAVARAQAKPALPLPDKPSIAVLPVENLSGDPKQERLAGGLTEDVITDLSRFRELFVIARNSTEVYKGKPVDVRQVARELGVQYVLEGSLQIDGDRVRITAQLIDGTTGNHVWAERYDRPLDEVFVIIQDEVTKTIAASLAGMQGVVARAGRDVARRKPPESLQAYENYLLGIEHKHRFTEEDNKKARGFLTQAIQIDPAFARAYVGLAMVDSIDIDNGWTSSQKESLDHWNRMLRIALSLDPTDSQAHMMLGVYYQYVGDLKRSRPEHEKAVSLNPNDADVLINAAWAMPWFGERQAAAELADGAVRLNPNYPDWYRSGLLPVYFYTGQLDRAVAATQSRLYPDMWDHVYRPLVYAQLGRTEDAAMAASDLLEKNPTYSAERFLSDTGTFSREVELNRFLDSNEKAGLPLCATEAQLAKYPDMKRLEQCEAERASG
jgi:TolB-like protein/class 3 adenylate cyclase/tetratricopeptide (TPR) repeat protein